MTSRLVRLALAAALLAPAAASAQLIRKSAPPPSSKSPSLEELARRVSEFSGAPVDPLAVDEGLPAPMAALVKACAEKPALLALRPGTTRTTQELEAKVWAGKLPKLREKAAPVNAAIAAYEARKAAVDAALAKAVAAKAAGDLAAAQVALEGVLTPVDMDADGNLKGKRHDDSSPARFLQPEDAEHAALQALADLAKQNGAMATAVDACALLTVRRPIVDVAHERYLMLIEPFSTIAFESQTFVEPIAGLTDSAAYSERELERKEVLQKRPWASALICLDRVLEGVPRAHLGGPHKAKKGQWVVLGLERAFPPEQVVDAQALRFHGVRTAWWPTSCKGSNRISHVDWQTGTVHYQQDCSWGSKNTRLDLDAKWGPPPPEWLSGEKGRTSNSWFVVMGKAAAVGPKWSLTDAFALPPVFSHAVPKPEQQ